MSCPSEEAWFLAELGDVTVNERDAMLAHRQGCAVCRAAHERQRQLLDDLEAAPELQASEHEFVERVMAECATGAASGSSAPAARMRRLLPWATGLLAAAAAVTLALMPAQHEDVGEHMQARGGNAGASVPLSSASADVYLARGATLQRLADATLGTGDRLAVRVVNKTPEKRYFMAFAIDAAGDVHWLFPAYEDATKNPEAPELPAQQEARVLPETVELIAPAEGKLRMVSMLTERRLNVKEVEGRLQSLPKLPLARVFPESQLREWSCTWQNR